MTVSSPYICIFRSLVLRLLLLYIAFAGVVFGQSKLDLESAKNMLENSNDSLRNQVVNAFLTGKTTGSSAKFNQIIAESYARSFDLDSAIFYYQQADLILKTSQDLETVLQVKKDLAQTHYSKGELTKADSILQICLTQENQLEDKDLQANIFIDAGWIAREQGRHAEALDLYFKAKTIAELEGFTEILADVNSKIAVVYHVKGEYKTAEKYYNASLKLWEELGNYERIARLYNNYGLLYDYQGDYTKAISYFERSIKMCDSLGNERGVAIANENLGLVCYSNLQNYPLAIQKFDRSLSIWRKQNDIYGQAQTLVYLMYVYNAQENYHTTLDTGFRSLYFAKASGARDVERDAYKEMSIAFEGLGQYNKALEYQKYHVNLKDSLDAINNLAEIQLMGIERELETKHLKDSLALAVKHQQNEAAIELKAKNQRFWLYLSLFGTAVLAVFLVLIIKNSQQRKKAADQINHAHHLLQEKNQEVIDSITYAKRIQQAILPDFKNVLKVFKSCFIYYEPKDIVAGDFYWMESVEVNGKNLNFFAVADCTGHGVPGAMVSVICSGALNKVVKEEGITNPAEILEEVSNIVVETFERGDKQINDGMDISLCCFDLESRKLTYAGANNALWIISENNKINADRKTQLETITSQLYEFKATKRPVGRYAKDVPFRQQEVQLDKNDVVYLFTDGYADQFGGEKNKKFKYKTLKDLILKSSHESMAVQKQILSQTLQQWKGGLEQVDDICIVGIKVS